MELPPTQETRSTIYTQVTEVILRFLSSYLAAVVLYATITGNDPVGLSHTTSLSNGLVLELQQAAAATVFNETSHLDYPWQTKSKSQITHQLFQQTKFLAWDSISSHGGLSSQYGNDIVVI